MVTMAQSATNCVSEVPLSRFPDEVSAQRSPAAAWDVWRNQDLWGHPAWKPGQVLRCGSAQGQIGRRRRERVGTGEVWGFFFGIEEARQGRLKDTRAWDSSDNLSDFRLFCECGRLQIWLVRGTDIAQWLEGWNSNPKTLGLIPWWVRAKDRFSVPLSQLLCRLVYINAWTPWT